MSAATVYPNPQFLFQQQYEAVRRDEIVGVLLAILLGGFGAHHFYLGRNGMGILYLCFFWTPIPWMIAFVECFFMPGRVRMYNAIQAAAIAASLGIAIPGYGMYAPPMYAAPQTVAAASAAPGTAALTACSNCGLANAPGARFCSGCGNALA
ncbi:MAG TPA: NINE protein [Acidobacteriaceae bacterium]|nr:NINE protein [Acidobacteriaceae bacterium]